MKNKETPETRKAFIRCKDDTKHWFDMPKETAEKVLRSSTGSL